MTSSSASGRSPDGMVGRVRRGDAVVATALLLVFAGACALSLAWPFRTALFPRLVSATGALLAVAELAALAIRARRVAATDQPAIDDKAEGSAEYVFASAGRRAWSAALAWIGGFFVALWLLGTVPTVPLFTLLYLRIAGRASWLAAAIYAAVAGVIVAVVFGRLLSIPMPSGVF
jgi:Tripartite tricarboxylate transporter TctB family